MTEPAVASSDATNIQTSIARDGDDYVINGRKWWTSGAGDPRCKIYIVMGKTDPEAREAFAAVDDPGAGRHTGRQGDAAADRVRLRRRAARTYGESTSTNVRVPASNILLGEGRGFEIAQGRLGPGRIHHCMRSIGLAERALGLMCTRLASRVAFGSPVAKQTVWQERIADARCMIDQARLLTLKAAGMMDTVGNKAAKAEIAMIKVVAPNVACTDLDWAIQAHGGGGMCDDFPLAYAYTLARTLRLADGPTKFIATRSPRSRSRKHVGTCRGTEPSR